MGATIVTILAVASIFSAIFPDRSRYYSKVRTSSLYEYPFFSIGESFENYFRNPGWAYYRGTEGLELVEFQGDSPDMSKKRLRSNLLLIINWVRLSRTHL